MTAQITCTRRIEFDAAHRLLAHEGKCKYLHGHRYVLEATFAADALDSVGRVIDFSVIKEKLGGWIDAHWDHNAILFADDNKLGAAIDEHTGQSVFYLPYNPTAENIVRYLLEEVTPGLFSDSGMRCVAMVLHETPNCHVSAT